ncbi:hypothetical protein RVM27_11190 [Halomonas sp. KM007]
MSCNKVRQEGAKKETLIRYAGSASEASTDSRPLGSELRRTMHISREHVKNFLDARPDITEYGDIARIKRGF